MEFQVLFEISSLQINASVDLSVASNIQVVLSKTVQFTISQHRPYIYVIYGNRAACYLKRKEYRSALSDGRRVTTLNPHWEKVS